MRKHFVKKKGGRGRDVASQLHDLDLRAAPPAESKVKVEQLD